ncbi:chitooligosaccharidolytic beta-N-acetylglucosaminidase [Diorhabda carinulata]|uniref:chitooligosaccharidolytic beta-N-acetylglucosaminidase n=1 Tax=Diorhabda carinulata TaxID=1163345 RepID=UPI0025A30DD8|nr:chitooligosaccharidolytic beta-N-acetylglucosaminidase [Diorhabda carinulata]
MFDIYLIIYILGVLFNDVYCDSDWIWKCDSGYCIKKSVLNEREGYISLPLCQLVCSEYLNIWPKPTGTITSTKELVIVNTKRIAFDYNGPPNIKNYLATVTQYFEDRIENEGAFSCDENMLNLKISLNPINDNLSLTVDTNEMYLLSVRSTDTDLIVNITAPTVFGVRHGIETFLQLLLPQLEDTSKCLSTVSNLEISDKPIYRHRGLLIDTARNYLSVDTIKKQIDGMAVSKLNVLHWHITDSQSFPLASTKLPNMTKFGAYSPTKIYTKENMRSLVKYAETRGVRILIEIDGPSHAGMGWQWGNDAGLGNLAVCVNKQPWRSFCIQPPCGQLNPVNQKLYDVLTDLYKDIVETIPDSLMFHQGGDEVFIPCWNSTPEILEYLKNRPLTQETYFDLWGEFQKKNLKAFDQATGHNKTSIIVWSSHLTDPSIITKYLSKERFIIQTWVPESENDLIKQLLNLGYRVIISTKDKWYLDHGFWGEYWTYHKWKTVYDNTMYSSYNEAILGGEVCMWGELVDDTNIDSRVWPRAAAAAERMWTNPSTAANTAEYRMFAHRERLIKLGIHADAVMPEWCIENEGECNGYL